jgi:CRP/FNR family transcriptional regulator, cyclic AMP receptor protein
MSKGPVHAVPRSGAVSGFSPEALDLSNVFRVETYPSGAIIYQPGDPADRVFLLRAGRVRLLRPPPESRQGIHSMHALLRAGDLFGEAMRPPGSVMEEIAVAQGETEVWTINGRELRSLIEARPPLALDVIRGLNERVRSLRGRVHALTFKEVPARLAESILSLSETHGEPCVHGNGEVDLRGVTQQDLADLVGASRSFVSTLINEMKRDGLLTNVGRVMCVRNRRELRQLAAKDRL